jgi:hypothetical protein
MTPQIQQLALDPGVTPEMIAFVEAIDWHDPDPLRRKLAMVQLRNRSAMDGDNVIPFETIPGMPDLLDNIGGDWLRARLLRQPPGRAFQPHVDPDPHRFSVLVPIETNEKAKMVTYSPHEIETHLPLGTCWLLDVAQTHSFANEGDTNRTHLQVQVTEDAGWERKA